LSFIVTKPVTTLPLGGRLLRAEKQQLTSLNQTGTFLKIIEPKNHGTTTLNKHDQANKDHQK
jgi:hypothetical protein